MVSPLFSSTFGRLTIESFAEWESKSYFRPQTLYDQVPTTVTTVFLLIEPAGSSFLEDLKLGLYWKWGYFMKCNFDLGR